MSLVLLWGLTACGGGKPATLPAGETASPAACGDTGPQLGAIAPECCGAPWVEIGTGEQSFEPLAPGDPVVMVHGPQGGWHLLGAARVHDTRDVVTLRFGVSLVETGEPVTAELSYPVQLVPDGECAGDHYNLQLFLDISETGDGTDTGAFGPATLACRALEIALCARDSAGREACSTLQVVAEADPQDIADGLAAPCEE